ncbi:S-glutathionyl-(chloro)hydroquinone reductase [Lobulomyces angularis]|nr:S-glutathionyl-(chloro)hydroquinone reductase [Lobulomyces angularis]
MSGNLPSILKFADQTGEYKRQVSTFRDQIEPGSAKFPPAVGRYRLYISHACPWANRTAIVRALKNLEKVIDVIAVDYLMTDKGWHFSDPKTTPGSDVEPQYNFNYLSELYKKANPNYSGRYTVPVLWDSVNETIVNNESSEIIRMLNTCFDEFIDNKLNFYPIELQSKIDEVNSWIYDDINNGVYKAGFATKQNVYEDHCIKVFKALDKVENELLGNNQKYLINDTLTEADIRLFTTIIRFDPVYVGHFKCNLKTIQNDYPNIMRWLKNLYFLNGVKETINMDHIKKHYYMSHLNINPNKIYSLGGVYKFMQ